MFDLFRFFMLRPPEKTNDAGMVRHNPGAMWRSLALEEKTSLVTMCDSDRAPMAEPDILRTEEMVVRHGRERVGTVLGLVCIDILQHITKHRPARSDRCPAGNAAQRSALLCAVQCALATAAAGHRVRDLGESTERSGLFFSGRLLWHGSEWCGTDRRKAARLNESGRLCAFGNGGPHPSASAARVGSARESRATRHQWRGVGVVQIPRRSCGGVSAGSLIGRSVRRCGIGPV